jgi:cellulose synthase/poly-beta-1,6-N-acetylglucosamine synthase-like glycosyltransferase
MPFTPRITGSTLAVVPSAHIERPRTLALPLFSFCIALLQWKPVEWAIVVSFFAVSRDPLLYILTLSFSTQVFVFHFVFKFLKVVVHTVSYSLYRPMPTPRNPTLTSKDCTVIVPTVGDLDDEFVECIRSILACNPKGVIISTVGHAKLLQASKICSQIDPHRIDVVAIDCPSKRAQVVAAVKHVKTHIVILADDHVFWPTTFLSSAIAPFEDNNVGLVGTVKRVRRTFSGFNLPDFLNYIATIYLERHNFECTASSFIDGGVFVISGRTALLRTSIIQSPSFQHAFLNETWLWGRYGPLNVDDDNFTCRWMVNHGHKIVFQNAPEALMETTLGTTGGWKKFRGQLDRWARTTWRSNATTLFADRTVWRSQPWCVYAVYISAFVNLALFYDSALFVTLYFSSFETRSAMWWLGGLLFASKLIKPLPHYMRNPRDLVYLPFGILFGYYHSFIKLNALFTCTNVAWGTRAGVDGPVVPTQKPNARSLSS